MFSVLVVLVFVIFFLVSFLFFFLTLLLIVHILINNIIFNHFFIYRKKNKIYYLGLQKQFAGKTVLEQCESKYLAIFGEVDLTKDYYFSYTYNLTHTVQTNILVAKEKMKRMTQNVKVEQVDTNEEKIKNLKNGESKSDGK